MIPDTTLAPLRVHPIDRASLLEAFNDLLKLSTGAWYVLCNADILRLQLHLEFVYPMHTNISTNLDLT